MVGPDEASGAGGVTVPAASVIIPAHDEELVIERCLRTLLSCAEPGEFDVVVVANGCTDRTAVVARSWGRDVRVVETPIGEKTAALNLGDEATPWFPRIYLDADVLLDTSSARAVVRALSNPSVLAAAPVLAVDTTGCPLLVRSYYQIWLRLPWVGDSMIGAGVYALSERGRSRFDRFPPVKADDLWVSAQFAPEERLSVVEGRFTIFGARAMWPFMRRLARIATYNALARPVIRSAPGRPPRAGAGVRELVRREPSLLPHAAVYVAVAGAARLWGSVKARCGSVTWVTDR